MKNYSIWLDTKARAGKKLNQNLEVDVLIIGGGIAGMSTLYQLKDSGLNVVLVDRGECGGGVTARSTAKITYLQEKIMMNIRKFVGYDVAKKYLQSQIYATHLLKDIIQKEKIDCDLKQVESYLFTNEENHLSKLEEEYQFLLDCGVDVQEVNQVPFDEKVKKAIKVSDTYVFHPLKYIHFLKDKFYDSIYEHSSVKNIQKEKQYYLCQVNDFIIKAKYVVVATHYPYFLIPFMTPFKTHVETSYIGAIKTEDFSSYSAINIDKPTISFRYHTDLKNHYLIYLYQSFLSCNIRSVKDNFNELLKKYPFHYIWSNKDIITNDYMPYIGAIYKNNHQLLMASGFNTWGMTNGTLAGKILADIILNQNNPYIDLFSPNRSFNLSKFIRLPLDLGSSAKAIIKSTKNNVNNSKVIYKKIKGVNVAIYKDDNGVEHTVLNRCPHMKCGIVFNEVEKTWDCYCHGSRFDIDGKVIEGPSNYDITFH